MKIAIKYQYVLICFLIANRTLLYLVRDIFCLETVDMTSIIHVLSFSSDIIIMAYLFWFMRNLHQLKISFVPYLVLLLSFTLQLTIYLVNIQNTFALGSSAYYYLFTLPKYIIFFCHVAIALQLLLNRAKGKLKKDLKWVGVGYVLMLIAQFLLPLLLSNLSVDLYTQYYRYSLFVNLLPLILMLRLYILAYRRTYERSPN